MEMVFTDNKVDANNFLSPRHDSALEDPTTHPSITYPLPAQFVTVFAGGTPGTHDRLKEEVISCDEGTVATTEVGAGPNMIQARESNVETGDAETT
jgi:hypothetical protein